MWHYLLRNASMIAAAFRNRFFEHRSRLHNSLLSRLLHSRSYDYNFFFFNAFATGVCVCSSHFRSPLSSFCDLIFPRRRCNFFSSPPFRQPSLRCRPAAAGCSNSSQPGQRSRQPAWWTWQCPPEPWRNSGLSPWPLCRTRSRERWRPRWIWPEAGRPARRRSGSGRWCRRRPCSACPWCLPRAFPVRGS